MAYNKCLLKKENYENNNAVIITVVKRIETWMISITK